MSILVQTSLTRPTITWPLLPEDFILPDEPVENSDQPLIATALRQPLTAIPEYRQNALIVSNFALCAGIDERTICKAPDWMYVRPVKAWESKKSRRSYTPHTEGVIPQVVIEFLSATYGEEYSMESNENVGKWFFYEQVIQVPNYVIFRPDTGRIEVYALKDRHYEIQLADPNGRYWIAGLDLFLGVWEGSHEDRTGYWLRWWNVAGELLLWSEELTEKERIRAEQERQAKELALQQVELLLERLRQIGVDPEQL